MTSDTDRIEKKIELRASRSRVWRALTNAEEFGAWFGVNMAGPFVQGAYVQGRITHPEYSHLSMNIWVDRIEPESFFSYRWHPYAVDPKIDYSHESPTLVEFHLEQIEAGTLLTVSESGFDRIPHERRAEAYRMNTRGWAEQLRNIERHVVGA